MTEGIWRVLECTTILSLMRGGLKDENY